MISQVFAVCVCAEGPTVVPPVLKPEILDPKYLFAFSRTDPLSPCLGTRSGCFPWLLRGKNFSSCAQTRLGL